MRAQNRLFLTRRERLKSALYLRLKKRKVFKSVKGDPFDFLKIQFVAKLKEALSRRFLKNSKIFLNFKKKQNFETV